MPDDSKFDEVLIEVEGMRKWFPIKSGMLTTVKSHVRAVDGVDLQVKRGETLGIVGESGCGKTTLGRVILGLTHMTEGSVHYDGEDIRMMTNKDLRRRLQIVFQDPGGSMNPRMSVRSIVGEPLQVNGMAQGAELTQRVADLLDSVGKRRMPIRQPPYIYARLAHDLVNQSGNYRIFRRHGIAFVTRQLSFAKTRLIGVCGNGVLNKSLPKF